MIYIVKSSESAEMLTIVEDPIFIMLNANGIYVSCDIGKAQGVSIDGTPYHLGGRSPMKGTEETVFLDPANSGKVVHDLMTQLSNFMVDASYRITLIELTNMSGGTDATNQ